MSSLLEKWIRDKTDGPSLELTERFEVTGVVNRHVGPRWLYARIGLELGGAAENDVTIESGLYTSDEELEMIESAVFGLLDVLMNTRPRPLRNVHVTVTEADFDPESSSVAAFREAGRHAGEQVVAKLPS